MKKYFYALWMMAALLVATTSCSNEDELIPSGNNGVEVSFKLAMDGVVPSRTIGNNATDDTYGRGQVVDNVIAAVYSAGTEIATLRKSTNTINDDLTCNVTFRLIEGQTYDFVFWAEKKGTGFYDTKDLKAIKVNYDEDKKYANDESRDAFTAVRKGLVVKKGGMSENIVLTRPFAQLNIASTDEDHAIAEAAGFGCNKLMSKVSIKGVYNVFNAYEEKPITTSTTDIDFDLANVPGNSTIGEVLKNVKEKNDATGKNYEGYLSMNYFLASTESSQNIEVVARFESSTAGSVPVEITVPHVPVQRNYRTNIIGNILTEQTVFNIIIDPNFKEPDYVVGWDGKTVTAVTPVNGVYEVSSPSQLAWIAQQVNEGKNSFEKLTVKLTDHINLGKQNWTPIGTAKNPFKGIFDGAGYHVDAFNVSTTEAAGLFGILNGTIQNMTIESASVIGGAEGAGIVAGRIFNTGKIDKVTVLKSNVEGNHWVGAIVGYAYGTITNCTVQDVTVTATPNAVSRALTYNNGDKVGGIVGQHPYDADGEVVENNTVTNVTLKGYRDIGGIAGAADGSRVKGNKVSNVNIIWDQKNFFYEDKDDNTGEIVGRLEGTTLAANEASNVVIAEVQSDMDVEGLAVSEDGSYLISTAEALTWLAEEVNSGENFRGKTIKLIENIDLKNTAWSPIGNSLDNKFEGNFDGDGKTISNYVVNEDEGAGLFGFVSYEASIKNLTVANVTVTGNHFAGAMAGWVQSVDKNHTIIIENCHAKNVKVTIVPNANNDDGNHAGGLMGYTVRAKVTGCTVDNAIVTAYRDCGGLIGGAMAGSVVEDNTVTNSVITSDQTADYCEEGKLANVGKVAGRTDTEVDLTSNTAGDDVLVYTKNKSLILASGTYVFENKIVEAAEGSAITLEAGAEVTLEVKGEVTLTGAAGGNGIYVPSDATLKIIGDGNLTVIGNGGVDDANGGSGIAGSVTIDGLSSLTAEGWGKHGFGIGSADATVIIKNTKNVVAQGGYVQPSFVQDTSYGKKEPEGAPAIGGEKITLTNTVVTEAHGGSKAAAIGARYHGSTEVNIDGCTITVYGGNASAGIGGSRVTKHSDQTIAINIANSTITATGGEFGSGIGSGYNTYTSEGKISKNEINITKSEITAKGGRGASGIGTGYHVATLTGSIDSASTITATAGDLVDEDVVKWNCRITYPQAVGYGGVDPSREYKDVVPTFTVKGVVVAEPTEYIKVD